LFHYREELFELSPALKPFESFILNGHYAVPLFFILSGFILSHVYFARSSLMHWDSFSY
jgi:peptidoglycan/LPS O-acetylase OafA/YrhL